jgi:type III secretion system FlhB-like substrate exporter
LGEKLLPLEGIEFPKDKNKVIDYAEKNKTKLDEAEQVINTLKEIPDKTYHNMAEVEKALGTIR